MRFFIDWDNFFDQIKILFQKKNRYWEISYFMVPGITKMNRSNYIDFVSFNNTAIHNEVARFLTNFDFLGNRLSRNIFFTFNINLNSKTVSFHEKVISSFFLIKFDYIK